MYLCVIDIDFVSSMIFLLDFGTNPICQTVILFVFAFHFITQLQD